MSYSISLGDAPNCIWMIRNEIFRWFIKLVIDRYGSDPKVSDVLMTSLRTHGLSLDQLERESPDVARDVVEAISAIAREIAAGNHVLLGNDGEPWPEMQEKCNAAFDSLYKMLHRGTYGSAVM